MNIKKILAAAAASTLAVTALSAAALADSAGPSKAFTVDVNADADGGKLVIPVDDIPAGTVAIKFEISFEGDGAYGGGAIGRNINGTWTQDDTKYTADDPASLTQLVEVEGIDAGSNIELQCWWINGTMNVKTTYVSDGGDVDPEPSPNPVVPDEEGTKPATDTGVGGVAAVLGIAVIAGGALVVAKKKN